MTTAKLTPTARRVLSRLAAEGPMFCPQPSQRLYITQRSLVRAGLAQWTPNNTVEITEAGRATLA